MSTPPLIRHGQHVKPHYAPTPGQSESWADKSIDADRPDGNISGIVKRYKKDQQASDAPEVMDLVGQQYVEAIAYSAKSSGLRGMALLTALTANLILGYLLLDLLDRQSWRIQSYMAFVMFSCGIVFFWLFAIRMELFRPLDEPTIFDRKHRKVYHLFCEAQPGLFGLFKPWPLRVCEYDWDLIDVEHNATMVTTGATVRRDHALIFIVRRSADDPTIIDSFNIGNSVVMPLDRTVDGVWEHIRRFMEEQGPHLPPGAGLAPPNTMPGLWQRWRKLLPWSPEYRMWWREFPGTMVVGHILLPFTVAYAVFLTFFSWLSDKTSKPVVWPAEVLERLGPAQGRG